MMFTRISDQEFEALSLSGKLEVVAAELHDLDAEMIGRLNDEDVIALLQQSISMAREAKVLEAELARIHDARSMGKLRFNLALDRSANGDSTVVPWPIIPRKAADQAARSDFPKGVA